MRVYRGKTVSSSGCYVDSFLILHYHSYLERSASFLFAGKIYCPSRPESRHYPHQSDVPFDLNQLLRAVRLLASAFRIDPGFDPNPVGTYTLEPSSLYSK
jgi:hypothetical protein